jgi:hypothetical protein
MIRLTSAMAIVAIPATVAIAHPGDHSSLAFATLGRHLLEWDHLAILFAMSLVGGLAYRAGRRAEARAVAAKERCHDPR